MHGNGAGPGLCESGVLERPRYFPRQLLTPAEMTLEQSYFRDRQRRHNRLLHGWGVVCGAQVCLVPNAEGSGPEPWKVRVQPGYVLGPQGDEIVIDAERELDLRTGGMIGVTGQPTAPDPWCSEVLVRRAEGPLYVAVRYREVEARPVRVQPVGCGCDDSQCEYSRLRDGYELCVLTSCPPSHANPPAFEDLAKGLGPGCPACPPDPWVVLAEVQLGADGEIQQIDNCGCRRLVLSLAQFWWQCTDGLIGIDQVTVTGTPEPGEEITLDVTGTNFQQGATATLGRGVAVQAVDVTSATQLEVKAAIAETTVPGPRTMTVTNPDCTVGVRPNAITVAPRSATPARSASPRPSPEKRPTAKRRRTRGGGKGSR